MKNEKDRAMWKEFQEFDKHSNDKARVGAVSLEKVDLGRDR